MLRQLIGVIVDMDEAGFDLARYAAGSTSLNVFRPVR